jgi:UDP-4-amino-4-deoxy-L-arabinose formyltransferase/UDP-glucuronic acid dehydrogenase (UDP-4-keto-hexauronic acid decarboxylating)
MRVVVMCTVNGGVDAVLELARLGVRPVALVGLAPDKVNHEQVSGWVDVAPVASRIGAEAIYVQSYTLKGDGDRAALEATDADIVLVTGWQRLIPEWLISLGRYGALGAHGSPDGIDGGRGRSPQNWALLLGCDSFELSVFRITPGVDDGPVLASRTFHYLPGDDIRISHYRASLAMAHMMAETLQDPERLALAKPQRGAAFYYPQRKPEDGWVDWGLEADHIARHSRALTRPYPGLRSQCSGIGIRLWECRKFDDQVRGPGGLISACFESGEFLVHTVDGRLLVREWSAEGSWRPSPGDNLEGRPWRDELAVIVERHQAKYPDQPITDRIVRRIADNP